MIKPVTTLFSLSTVIAYASASIRGTYILQDVLDRRGRSLSVPRGDHVLRIHPADAGSYSMMEGRNYDLQIDVAGGNAIFGEVHVRDGDGRAVVTNIHQTVMGSSREIELFEETVVSILTDTISITKGRHGGEVAIDGGSSGKMVFTSGGGGPAPGPTLEGTYTVDVVANRQDTYYPQDGDRYHEMVLTKTGTTYEDPPSQTTYNLVIHLDVSRGGTVTADVVADNFDETAAVTNVRSSAQGSPGQRTSDIMSLLRATNRIEKVGSTLQFSSGRGYIDFVQ